MASFDVNATASETWIAPTAAVSRNAKPAPGATSPLRKMANSTANGSMQSHLPASEDMASFESHMLSNDVARNLLLLSMLSSDFSFANTMAGNVHPLFNGLLPVALPHQQFGNMLPHNANIPSRQQNMFERTTARLKQRPSSFKSRGARNERKTVPSTVWRSTNNVVAPPVHMNPPLNATPISSVSNNNMPKGDTIPLARNGQERNSHEMSRSTESSRRRIVDLGKHRNQHVSTSKTTASASIVHPHKPDSRGNPKQTTSFTKLNRLEGCYSRAPHVMNRKCNAAPYKSHQTSSFNEVEAAATLLDMRLGQGVGDGNGLLVTTDRNLHLSPSVDPSRSRGFQPISSVQSKTARTHYQGPYEAVDLSIKSKSKTSGANGVLNSNPTAYHCKPASGSTRIARNNATVDSSRETDIIKTSRAYNRDIDTTALVSQYADYVCAFDMTSPVAKSTCGNSQVTSKAHIANPSASQHAFNYKKVICEKFSQCTSPSTITHVTPQRESVPRTSNTAVTSSRMVTSGLSSSRLNDVANSSSLPPDAARYTNTATKVTARAHTDITSSVKTVTNRPVTRIINEGMDECTSISVSKQLDTTHAGKLSSHVAYNENKNTSLGEVTRQGKAPSFSDLRQQSKDTNNVGRNVESHGKTVAACAPHAKSFKSSNLYRIRNSNFGGSNDSLHSSSSEKGGVKEAIDSESSSSSSESEVSGESDLEDEIAIPRVSTQDKTSIPTSPIKSSPTKTRFVLSQPKFTLNNHETSDEKAPSESQEAENQPNKTHHSSKTPTSFKIPTAVSNGFLSSATSNASSIPELKCDESENPNTFKSKFIKALSNPGSKEGLAVDGKHLRALLGDRATCFYHNNKKYVLTRYLKPKEPPKDAISEDAVQSKMTRHVNRQEKSPPSPEPDVQRKIEPRISVTAVKRDYKSVSKDHSVATAKKCRKTKRRHVDITRKLSSKRDSKSGRRVKRPILDEVKITPPLNKRRRRNHEIENLVYEGAGGKTPIPDLSLRDSDVFSNIKLRRREAAKRWIAPTKAEEDEEISADSVLCRERIKTAAHKRAIANKNRKKSIESKLRKYRKKDRSIQIRKEDPFSTPTRTCVRINAGTSSPQLNLPRDTNQNQFDIQSYSVERNNISVFSQQPQSTPSALTDASSNSRTAFTDSDVDSEECVTFITSSKVSKDTTSDRTDVISLSKISTRDSRAAYNDKDNDPRRRRTSKRISARRRSNDRGSNEKKIDDDQSSVSSNNFETDSTRSDSSFQASYRNANNAKRKNCSLTSKSHRGISKSKGQKHDSNPRDFSIISCFPVEPALTLEAAFGDFRPSYSMKVIAKSGASPVARKWAVGPSALGIKQQLQRDVWRNMTLEMFTNG